MSEPGFRDVPSAFWAFLAALAIALAIALHAVFPRYDYRITGQDGRGIVIYDRWTGQFQRADYPEHGEPTLQKVLRPF
jgi:hypothetical protein